MSEIEKKALALVRECADIDVQGSIADTSIYYVHSPKLLRQALCLAIEQREALQADYAKLREALVMAFRAIDYHNYTHPYEPMSDFFPMVPQGSKIQSLSDARAALQEQSK